MNHSLTLWPWNPSPAVADGVGLKKQWHGK